MSCGIYKIENKLNHQVYIGQSINIEHRWSSERSVSKNPIDPSYNSILSQAFRKYGIENFDFSIIEECPREQLNDREIYWISYYDSYNNGYNATEGGNQFPIPQKLNRDTVQLVRQDLINTDIPMAKLGQKYGVSENMICGINTGYHWPDDNFDYPLRKIIKQEHFCIICGKPIDRKSTICIDCWIKQNSKVKERPNAEELSKLLYKYNGNFTEVAKLFNITDNSVRKWCKGYGLPWHSKDYKKQQPIKEKQIVSAAEKVAQIDKKTGQVIRIFNSLTQAEEITKIAHIREASNPANTQRKSAGGYIWKRINNN